MAAAQEVQRVATIPLGGEERILSSAILTWPGLSLSLKTVALYLWLEQANRKPGQHWVDLQQLARRLGASTSSARRWMEQLQAKGLLRVLRRDRDVCHLEIFDPDGEPASDEPGDAQPSTTTTFAPDVGGPNRAAFERSLTANQKRSDSFSLSDPDLDPEVKPELKTDRSEENEKPQVVDQVGSNDERSEPLPQESDSSARDSRSKHQQARFTSTPRINVSTSRPARPDPPGAADDPREFDSLLAEAIANLDDAPNPRRRADRMASIEAWLIDSIHDETSHASWFRDMARDILDGILKQDYMIETLRRLGERRKNKKLPPLRSEGKYVREVLLNDFGYKPSLHPT